MIIYFASHIYMQSSPPLELYSAAEYGEIVFSEYEYSDIVNKVSKSYQKKFNFMHLR